MLTQWRNPVESRNSYYMNSGTILRALVLLVLSLFSNVTSRAEESSGSVTPISSTTIGGYVDTTASFANTNASAHGFAGTWIGIVTGRASTNRVEFYLRVDGNGNFSGRGMNFDRSLGSDQLDGTLNENGKARLGQTRFHLHRSGVGTLIGRSESGRVFTARLLREQIRQSDSF